MTQPNPVNVKGAKGATDHNLTTCIGWGTVVTM